MLQSDEACSFGTCAGLERVPRGRQGPAAGVPIALDELFFVIGKHRRRPTLGSPSPSLFNFNLSRPRSHKIHPPNPQSTPADSALQSRATMLARPAVHPRARAAAGARRMRRSSLPVAAAAGNGNGSSSANAGGDASSSSSSASSASSSGTVFDPRLSSDEIELWDDNGGPPTPLLVRFFRFFSQVVVDFAAAGPGQRQPLIDKNLDLNFIAWLSLSLSFLLPFVPSRSLARSWRSIKHSQSKSKSNERTKQNQNNRTPSTTRSTSKTSPCRSCASSARSSAPTSSTPFRKQGATWVPLSVLRN